MTAGAEPGDVGGQNLPCTSWVVGGPPLCLGASAHAGWAGARPQGFSWVLALIASSRTRRIEPAPISVPNPLQVAFQQQVWGETWREHHASHLLLSPLL